MMNRNFTLSLSGAKIELLGSFIESHKKALDALAIDVQQQVNMQIAAVQKAAADAQMAEEVKAEEAAQTHAESAEKAQD